MLDKTKLRSEHGYTITELIVSITLIGIISVVIMTVVSNYLVIITRNNYTVDMTVSSQNLLRSTVEELRYGAGVRQTNSISDPSEPGGWSMSDPNKVVIIIAQPAINSSREYIIDPLTGQPYMNELIYHKQDNILYRRTLRNEAAVDNRAATSCPPALATSSCPADTILSESLESMTFTFYDQDNAVTADLLATRALTIDLVLAKKTFGEALTLDNSITVAFRNRF